MFGYDDLQLSLAHPLIYFLIALILLIAYSVWVYKFTVPPVSKFKKIILTMLRSLAFLILLLVLFEPILTLTKAIKLKPLNLIYFDNSRSLQIDDNTNRVETVNKILNDFKKISSNTNFEYHTFGNEPKALSIDTTDTLSFNEGITNISSVFNSLDETEANIASVTLISDGVITSGSNPIYAAEKIRVPVYTIGIGDTSRRDDVVIKKILFNEILYAETPTRIHATILNKGFGNNITKIELFENGVLVEQKVITLSTTGVQNEEVTYLPKISGEKKLHLKISTLKGEFTSANNTKIFYVNVLSNKIKVMIIAGSPSPDLSFIKNSLSIEENYSVATVTEVTSNKILESGYTEKIESADVLFLLGFPASNSSQDLLNLINKKILDEKTPFFILLSSGLSVNNLSPIKNELPFYIEEEVPGSREVQLEILASELNNPIIQTGTENVAGQWNNLPPIHQPKKKFKAKPESRTLAQIKINSQVFNEPSIITRNFSRSKSIAVLGYNIWKWKLQTAKKKINLFDNFIINAVKWLHSEDAQEQVKITTTKKSYSIGEKIEFSAQVYDESFNPFADAQVSLNISDQNENYEIELDAMGSGIYSGEVNLNKAGDFKFKGIAKINETVLGEDEGSFSIDEINVEYLDPVMDYELLSQIALVSGGKYYSSDEVNELITELQNLASKSKKEKESISEISLWSSEWMLIFAVLFFAIEWFIRKQSGML